MIGPVFFVLVALGHALYAPSAAHARNTQVLFDPARPGVGPFPTDFLTLPDPGQRTGLRVNLPLPPDCAATPSDCAEIQAINQLDGFSPTARLTISFNAAISPETLRDNVYVGWLDSTLAPGRYSMYPTGKLSPVNQFVWDPATRTATMKPDEMLEQSRAFLLIVTDGVRDTALDPVETSDGYRACAARQTGGTYCERLADALLRIQPLVGGGRRIVAASLFTTLSVTAFLEEARRIVQNTPAQFRRTQPSVSLDNLASIEQRLQTRTSAGAVTVDSVVPIPAPLLAASGAGSIAFGSYRSPQFATADSRVIAHTPTAEPVPAPADSEEIHFHVWLPRTPPPPGGYPVLIAGHGIGDFRFGMPTAIALYNQTGMAVVAVNAVGHGYGPNTSVVFTHNDGSSVTAALPGRSVDADGNGAIDPAEGCVVSSPRLYLALMDCLRQTAVDLMQLTHAMRDGMDFDGDGRPDLNGNMISYLGQSLGSAYGTLFLALEPDVRSAVLNVAPGSMVELGRTSESLIFRFLFLSQLSTLRQPSLLNDPSGLVDEWPFRNEPVRIRTRPGAAALQDYYDRVEWLEATRSAQCHAPYLRTATLPGVVVRPILFQYAWGDTTVPNQTTTALIRAANMREFTSLYRADVARAANSSIPRDVHTYLLPLGGAAEEAVALATIAQMYRFLVTGEMVDVNPLARSAFNGRDVFETPPAQLPERPNYPPR